MAPTDIEDLYDISSFFTELAVCEYYFVGQIPSLVAVSSIINALEGMFGPDNKVAVAKLAHDSQEPESPSSKLQKVMPSSSQPHTVEVDAGAEEGVGDGVGDGVASAVGVGVDCDGPGDGLVM